MGEWKIHKYLHCRCKRLFGEGQSSIYIHSIGSGIPVALNLALQLQKSLGDRVGIETATSFVELSGNLITPVIFH